MKTKVILWVFIGILFLAVLLLTFKVSTLNATGNAVTSNSGGKMDTTGWTENEIMNYEMHGTIPARAGKTATSGGSSGMVGGC